MEHKINFLDITINREPNKISIDVYRKLTYTDVIIPNDSCHTREHKMAAINYLYNRMNTYHLSPEKWQKGNINIQQSLKNNEYSTTTLERREKPKQDKNKTQWAKFTYSGKETRAITKEFKNTNLRIVYSTNNTIRKLLTARHQQPKCKYEKCGIYQITCPTCNMKYTGQTGALTINLEFLVKLPSCASYNTSVINFSAIILCSLVNILNFEATFFLVVSNISSFPKS